MGGSFHIRLGGFMGPYPVGGFLRKKCPGRAWSKQSGRALIPLEVQRRISITQALAILLQRPWLVRHLQGWSPTRDHKTRRNELLLPILVSVGELLVACSYGGGLCYLPFL
jgi:hypothetical protein